MGWRCPKKGCRQEVAPLEGIFNSLKILMQVQYFSLLSYYRKQIGYGDDNEDRVPLVCKDTAWQDERRN